MLRNVQKQNDLNKSLGGGVEKAQHSKIRVVNRCAVTVRYCENMEKVVKWLKPIKFNVKV